MDLGARLEALLSVAEQLEVEVRAEPMSGEGGGMCRLKGRRVLFVDTTADLATRYERTLAAMADLPELEGSFLPPQVRDDLERQREASSGGAHA
jgi:hypothetical protein